MTNQPNSLPEGPGIAISFLYYFSTTTMIVAFFYSQSLDTSMFSPLPYRYGMVFGVVTGAIGAYLNRSKTISTSFKKSRAKQEFSNKLQEALVEMGFEPKSEEEDYTIYGKSSLKSFFAGKIFVQIDKKSAAIAGRATDLKKLSKKLDI